MMASWFAWLTPVGILLAALLVGLWLRQFLIPRLLRVASRTSWKGGDIIIQAIRGPIVLWSMMAGIYLAMESSAVPSPLVHATGQLLQGLWIFSVAWVSANAASRLITVYASSWQLMMPLTSLTQNLAKLAIFSLAGLMILESVGVKISSLLAALGIGSLAVALGLQDTLTNLFSGIYLTLSKNVRVGDYIKLESGEEGYVTDISWRSTKIQMLPNNVVIVPNAKLGQSILTNYYLPDKELAVVIDLGVAYDSDLDHVERVTCAVAREVMQTVPGGVASFEPFIRYHTFGDYSIKFTVIMRGKEFVDQYLLKHELLKRLHVRYAKEGIRIPFPTQTMVSADR